MDAEERVRRQAVRRVLAGERVAEVAAALGRTERWLFKWLSRYDPADEGWARERSRAPEHVADRSDPKLEALVRQVRARLAAQPWSQVGAPAIAWELEKLPSGGASASRHGSSSTTGWSPRSTMPCP